MEFVVIEAATVSDLLDSICTAIYRHVPRYATRCRSRGYDL